MVKRARGTRDFLDLKLMHFAIDAIKKHLKKYNFKEILTPLIEETALFKRSLGNDTDVVSKEMFIVSSSSEQEQDKEDSLCLRPEATASIVRAFVENGIQIVPWKVFLSGQMYRYERPQKGRYREFFQTSIEIIGAHSIRYDVQLLSLLDTLFRDIFLLESYALHINFIGCAQDRIAFKSGLETFLQKYNDTLCATCLVRKEKNILRVFDCKNTDCQKIYSDAPRLTDVLCNPCAQEWTTIQNGLEELAVSFVHMPYLVRGLDYYNKTVFEFVSPHLGAQSAFCAGGRYDHLVANLGAKQDQPSLGAAIGIDRLLLLLEPLQNQLQLPYEKALCVIVPFEDTQQSLALQTADILIKNGIAVDVFLDGSVKSMIKKADKCGAKVVIFIGSDEQNQGTVTIKNLQSGEQVSVKQSALIEYIKNTYHF